MNKDRIWEDFVEESKKLKLIGDQETRLFDAIMEGGAAAEINVNVKFPYRKYIKEEQMEHFNKRLLFNIFLLKKQNENETTKAKAEHGTTTKQKEDN